MTSMTIALQNTVILTSRLSPPVPGPYGGRGHTPWACYHGVLFKYNRTQKQDLRDSIFGLSRQMTRNPPKNAHGKHKKTQRKRMANMEFSTSFFLSKSVLKVPRVQNSRKCGWCRGCQTVKQRIFFFFGFAVLRGFAVTGGVCTCVSRGSASAPLPPGARALVPPFLRVLLVWVLIALQSGGVEHERVKEKIRTNAMEMDHDPCVREGQSNTVISELRTE